MNLKKCFVAAVAVMAMAAWSGAQASAQENGNRENGKVVRGPYLTNRFGDNWFIGVGGGINLFGDGGYKPAVTPAVDVTVGKWITPSVGVRVGYQGVTGAEWSKTPSVLGGILDPDKDLYKQRFGVAYVHADALWNVSNAWSGYKETRFWNFVPYAHTGILATYNRKGEAKYRDLEFAAGVGLLNNLRLSNRLNLTLDLRGILVNGRHHAGKGGASGEISATLGLSVNLGRTNWSRLSSYHNPADADKVAAAEASAAALAAANKALEAEKAKLAKANAALAAENEDLKNRPVETKEVVVPSTVEAGVVSGAFYFELGSATLSDSELARLDSYMQANNIASLPAIYLTGSADTKTGSIKHNLYLAQQRVNNVKDLLVKKYGVPADKIVVRHGAVESALPELDRAVMITF